MRKVQVVRRPVVLSLGPKPTVAEPSTAETSAPSITSTPTSAFASASASASTAAVATTMDDNDMLEGTLVEPMPTTPRTSTARVSPTKRLAVMKQARNNAQRK